MDAWKKEPRKQLTLVIPFVDDEGDGRKVLLGKKLRGFGEGLYNGYGGKVEEEDESVVAAAVRELQEECSLESNVPEMEKARIGTLYFIFTDDGQCENLVVWEVHVFFLKCTAARMESARSSEEMTVEAFSVSSVPYHAMWEDDKLWWPFMLEGKPFKGDVHFTNKKPVNGVKQIPQMTKHEIIAVDTLPAL